MSEEGKKKVINVETGEITFEDYSNQEIVEQLAKGEQILKEIAANKDKAEKKMELLEKLGITSEEANLLSN
jgi:hypothetical protein